MADQEVGNLAVKVSMDLTGFQNGISNLNRQMRIVQSEFQAATAGLGNFEKTTEGLRLKIDSLNKQIELQRQKVAALEGAYQKSLETKGADAKATQELEIKLNKARAALASMEADLKTTTAELEKQSSAWYQAAQRAEAAGERMTEVGEKLQKTGREIAEPFAVASVAIGAALGSAVKTAADFEAQMDRVGAIAGASADELKAMEQAALDLGASTSKSASEVAEGMELMAAMGYNANQIIAAMPGVIAAAEASGEDMALVAETVAAALNSFGLEAAEASRVADVLAQTANMSAAGVRDMQYAFKYAAPVANALGISLEELAAAVGIMSNAGIRGEQAGTTLRAALIRLSDPPKEAANALKELGVSITDAQGNMLPFGDIIAQLTEKTANMSNAQKLAALSTIFGTEAASGMLTVIEAGPAVLEEFTKSLENSAGASQEAAALMKDNLKGALEELGGAFETAQVSIGNILIPLIREVAEFVKQLVDRFNSLSPEMQKFITYGALVAGAVTGVIAAFGLLVVVVGSVISAFGTITTALGGLSIGLSALTSPVGIAIAAIAALVAGLVYLYKTNDEVRSNMQTVWDGIKAVIDAVMPAILFIIKSVWNNIKGVISGVLNVIEGLVTVFAGVLTGDFKAMWEGIKQIFSGAIEFIFNFVQLMFVGKILAIFKNFTSLGLNVLKTNWANILNGVKQFGTDILNIFRGLWDNIIGTFNTFHSTGTGIFNAIRNTLTSIVQGLVNAVRNLFSEMSSAVTNTISSLKSSIQNIWNSIVSFFRSINLRNIGRDIIRGLINGITSMASEAMRAARNLADSVSDTIKSALRISSPSKVMEGYGKFISEGLARGIDVAKYKVSDSANRLVGEVTAPAAQAPVAAGGGVIVTGNTFYVRNDQDIKLIARELYNLQQRASRTKGVLA